MKKTRTQSTECKRRTGTRKVLRMNTKGSLSKWTYSLFLCLSLFMITNVSNAQIYLNTFTGASNCPTNGNTPAMATNSTGTPLTRSTITCNSTANVFNSTTLNITGSVSNTSYIEFSATANAGFQLNLTSLTFFRQASNSAPNQLEVRYSTDGFSTSTQWGAAPNSPTAGTNITWDFTDFSTSTAGTVTFRFYPYGTQRADLTGASSATGTFRMDDVTLNGTVTAVSSSSIAVGALTPAGSFTTNVGTPSSVKTFTVSGSSLTANLTVSAVTGYEYSTDGFATAGQTSLSFSPPTVSQTVSVRLTGASVGTFNGTATIASTGATGSPASITLNGTVNSLTPIINVGALTPGTSFSTFTGTPSAAQVFTVSGSNLSANLTVSSVTGYEYSVDGFATAGQSSLSLAAPTVSQTVSVRLTGASQGTFNGTITIASSGATGSPATITLNGTVSTPAFTPGNLVIFVAAASVSNTTGSIVELNTTSAGQSAINTYNIAGTGVNAIRFSGSASSTGYLANSNDGTLLSVLGANSTNTVPNVNTLNPRAVCTLNSSIAFNIATTYTGNSGSQTRCATSLDNATWYIGDQGGIYTNGTSAPSPSGNYRGVKSFGGAVYVCTSTSIGTISSPVGGTITALPGVGALTNVQDFYLVKSGSNGVTYDVLYLITNSTGSSNTAGTILKYSLVSGTWTANGTYTTTFGGFGLSAAPINGGGTNLYISTGAGALTGNSLLKVTDAAGYNSSINITTTITLYTAAAGTIIKGVAFTPIVPSSNTVALSVSTNSASEAGATVVTVTVTSALNVVSAETVSLAVTGSGITSTDYSLSNATIIIPSGSNTGSITFTILDDTDMEGTETATLTISAPSSGISLGAPVSQNIVITDNDNTAPTIIMDVATTSDYIDGGAVASSASPYTLSGVIADITDPASTLGVDFTINDAETAAGSLTVTAVSSNTSVVTNANVFLTGTGAARNVKITPTAVGYSNITVSVSDGVNTTNYVIAYAASNHTPDIITANTFWHTGMSDASDGIALDNNYYVTGDDEFDYLNVYSRSASGLPLVSYNYSSNLSLPDPGNPEVDVEATTRSASVSNKIYWSGSMSNGKSPFNNKPNRDRLFATTVTGTGAGTAFSFSGYVNIRTSLLSWGDANGYAFSTSAAAGVDSKAPNGFSIEGMTFGPDNTTLYIGLRAPLVPTANRTNAVIVPILNFESWFNNGAPSGNPTYGSPIELNLNLRGIREIQRLSNGTYIIIAGDPGDGLPSDLYKWTGYPSDAPVLVTSAASGVLKMEGFIPVNNGGGQLQLNQLQVVTDGGDVVLYNDGLEAKDLAANNRKFRSDILTGLDLNICTGFAATITPAGSTTFCSGDSVSLNVTAGNNNNTYLWSPGGATTQSINATASATYTVTVTNITSGCVATATQTVTVNPLPTVTASNVSGCTGSSIALSGSPAGGTFSVANPYSGPSSTYTYTYTDGNGCTATSAPATITVNPLPTVSFTLASTYPYSAPVTLTGSPAGGTFSGTGVTGNTFSPSTAGVGGPYTITYNYTDGNGCSNSVSHTTSIIAAYTGPSSSASPYVLPVATGVTTTAVLTTPNVIGGYEMEGIPDGLGAFDNGNGTFTLLMNHELTNSGALSGVTRAHGSKGAFVSKWIIDKSTLTVQSGSDLMQNVNLWNPGTSTYTTYNSGNPSTLAIFGRFCSADLPPVSAFYNSGTGLGTQERIYMNGEETNDESRTMAHIVTGTNSGTSWEIPAAGKGAMENAIACPVEQNKTILGLDNDGTDGQVYMYIGTKTNTGTEVQKAGLTNGHPWGVKVTGFSVERVNSTTINNPPAAGTHFDLIDLGDVRGITGVAFNTLSNTNGITKFSRPEDGAWDPSHPDNYYFNTTDQLDQVNDGIGSQVGKTRVWKLHFTDIYNPELGGTIEAVLDGTEGLNMLDNMAIDHYGHILLQEDVGNAAHNGKVWQYTIATDALVQIAKHDPSKFGDIGVPATLPFNQDEETSGIIDMQDILGAGKFLSVDQAHYLIPGAAAEGGQLFQLFNPATYAANLCATSSSSSITTCGSYTWNGHTYTNSGTFSYHTNNAAGCDSTVTLNLTINPMPVVTASNVSGCTGSSIALSGSPAGGTFSVANPYSGPSTTYTYTYTNANGCTATSAPATTTVNPLPSATITASNGLALTCANPSTVLSVPTPGGTTQVWNQNGVFYATASNPLVTVGATYDVTVTITATGCTATSSVTTTLNNTAPDATITATPGFTFCQGGSTVLSVPVTGTTSQVWNQNGVFFATASNPLVTVGATYDVTITDAANGCTATSSVTTIVNPLPIGSASNIVICNGDPSNLPLSADLANTTFTWTSAVITGGVIGNGSCTSGCGNSIADVLTNTGFVHGLVQYTITPTSASGCIGSNFTATVTLGAAPATPVISGPSVVCNLNTATYSVAAVPEATNYTWTVPTGVTGMTITSGQGTTSITVTISAGTVSGNVTCAASNNCGSSTTASMAVTKKPAVPGAISGPTSTCGQTTATYSITPVFGATSYAWTVPANMTIISGQGTTSINVSMTTAFVSGQVKVSAVNNCGNIPGTALNVTGNVPPAPVTVSGPTNVCGLTTATYSIAPVTGATGYNWTITGAGTIVGSNTGTSVTVALNGTSGGSISCAATNACGNGTARTLNLVVTAIQPGLISGPTTVCGVNTATYTVASVGAGYTYNWSLSLGAGWSITSGQGTNSITISGTSVTTNPLSGSVKVTSTNSCGMTSAYRTLAVTYCRDGIAMSNTETNSNTFSNIYPNPTSSDFTIDVVSAGSTGSLTSGSTTENQEVTVEVYDVLGNLVIHAKHQLVAGTNTMKTNMEDFKNGMYFVRLLDVDSNVIHSQTVVKQ